jgi:6-pyruvoyltetrahydropterin/6-carboxytetrahydropterin synthase
MFRLSREVRFAINLRAADDTAQAAPPANSHGGFPALCDLGHYLALRVTLSGALDPATGYMCNIKAVDEVVRRRVVPVISRRLRDGVSAGQLPVLLMSMLKDAWTPARPDALWLSLSPFLSVGVLAGEFPMTRLSHKFEFSASHRLHNPALSDEENRRIYGKCNNPHGHGHNYEVQVTLAGRPRDDGLLVDIPAFERTVAATVLERFDHKNLNVEVSEFADLIPSVENIARVIYTLLKSKFAGDGVNLASVTVWETPKTWCEYSQ